MVKFFRGHGRTERMLLNLMVMKVHPIVYLCVAISVWYSAVTVINGFYLPENHGLIFLDDNIFNIIVGNIGVLTGLALIIALRYARWKPSAILALLNVSAWSFTLAMLAWSAVWAGVVISIFFIILHIYISLASSLHETYGYASTKSPRQDFYEKQEQARICFPGEDSGGGGRDSMDRSS